MVSHTEEEYNRVMELRKSRLSSYKISKITNIPIETIDYWFYRNAKTMEIRKRKWTKEKVIEELKRVIGEIRYTPTCSELWKKLNRCDLLLACQQYFGNYNNALKASDLPINEVFEYEFPESSRELTPQLGYIIGVILGDGWVTKYKIGLEVSDKNFANFFAEQLEIWSKIKPSSRIRKPRDNMINGRIIKAENCVNHYIVELSGINFCKFIKERIEKLDWILKEDKEFQITVLKGLFDSEGDVCWSNRNRGRTLTISNTNIKLLYFIRNLCENLGLKTCVGKKYVAIYQGVYIKNFLILFNLLLKEINLLKF